MWESADSQTRLPDFNLRDSPSAKRKVLLYLGRIHPKKGLANLLKAWAGIRKPDDWRLVIAGWDQSGHEAQLKVLASKSGIRWTDAAPREDPGASLLFAGPQFGLAKQQWFWGCTAAILPSFSEGLPTSVLEAWAHSKPVLMTPQCNLPEGFAAGAAIPILPEPGAIVDGLERLFRADHEDLERMGLSGRDLVRNRFSWPKITRQLESVYYWMTGAGPKPECVQTL
jgi:poly(glycerol-phosphate) alpha-glucosyltransferase